MLLEDLDSLLAAASSPVPAASTGTAAGAGGPSGRKQKAYGAKGKAERKDARRQARKMDREAAIKSSSSSKKKQQKQQEEVQAKEGIDEVDNDDDNNDNGDNAGKSGSSGRKAGRSRSSSASAGGGSSLLESLVSTRRTGANNSSPKPNRRQQPSTKSAKSRREGAMEEDEEDDGPEEELGSEPESESEMEMELEMGQQKQQHRRIQTNKDDQKKASGSDDDDDDSEDGEQDEEDFDNMNEVDTDQEEDEEYVEEEEESDDGDDGVMAAPQTRAAKKETAEVGSPPIQRTRTRPYVRGRHKRTIEDDDDEDEDDTVSSGDNESSNQKEEDEQIAGPKEEATSSDAPDDRNMEEKAMDGPVLDDDDDDDDDEQEQAQASLGGVLAVTTSTTDGRRTPTLTSPSHRRTASNGGTGGGSASRPSRGGSSGYGRLSHGAGDALALMQLPQYPEEQNVNNDGDEETDGGNAPESQVSLESFFSNKSENHLTDPDGDPTNRGLLTQGSDIIGDDHQSESMAAKKARRRGVDKHRVVKSPYSINSRLSDAEVFQASTGSGGKGKVERGSSLSKKEKEKGRRHYDSDDDYQSETDHSVQDSDTDGPNHKHRRRRRSSRQKQQRENSAWYAGNIETDDDEENEFVDEDDEYDAGDMNSGGEVEAASKSRRRRGGEGAKRRARSPSNPKPGTGRSNAATNETTSIGGESSDDEVGLESIHRKKTTPRSAGTKRKESSVDETPRADNRSLTQMGRDAKKKKRHQKSSASFESLSKHGTKAKSNDDGLDSLSFHSQSQMESNVTKLRAIPVSKRSKGRPTGGAKKKRSGAHDPTSESIPKTKTDNRSKASASKTTEDPFMDRDPSIEAEKEDPIDEFEESLGIGPVDSDDDNEFNSTTFVDDQLAPHSPERKDDEVLAGSEEVVEVDKAESSPSTEIMGQAGRRRRQRLEGGGLENGSPSFTSPSVLETGTKLHEPTIRWSAQVTGAHAKASSSMKKARSEEARSSYGRGLVNDDLARDHSESDDDDDDALQTQPEVELSNQHRSYSSSEGENDDDGDPDYQNSQPMDGGQQPRQKKRRIAARESKLGLASALMATAGNPSDPASAPGKGKCRAPSKRVLATITKKLRTLSSQASQNQKDITGQIRTQADLYSELQQMRSLVQSPSQFDSDLKSIESGTDTTISTFSTSLKFMLSMTMDSSAKIDADGRRKRLSALCTCLRFFVDVPDADGNVATNIFNSFSRYGGDRPALPVVSEDMRKVLSDPKILCQLLISVQCQDFVQKRSRPNQVEIKLRAQVSYLSCACLSLINPERAVEQILSSPSSPTSSEPISIKNAVGNLHRLASSLDAMDSYSQVELLLLFLIRTRRVLLSYSREGTSDRRKKVALKTLKRLDESLASIYSRKFARLNMNPSSSLETKADDGQAFTSWARECTKHGDGNVRTFGCKAVFNPQNKDIWGSSIKVGGCVHINKSSLSFFVSITGVKDEENTFRTTDSSMTDDDTNGENTSAAAASFRRDRLSIERLYANTKLVEMYFDDWEDRSDESATDKPIAYIRESGAITIFLSPDGMRRTNLAQALDDKLQSNAIHIDIEKSEFAEFSDLLKGRGVVLVDGDDQDGQPASQGSMGSVTTASYRDEEESRVFYQVEYNTSKIRGAHWSQNNTGERSDDDAAVTSQDNGAEDEHGRTGVGLGEDDESIAFNAEVDIPKQDSVPKRKEPSLGKRKGKSLDDDDDDDDDDNDVGQKEIGSDANTSKGGKRSKQKNIDVDQGSARATKKSRQQKKQVAEKQPHTARAQTREVTPLPESNASGRHDKQTSTSPTPYRSNSTKGTSQNLDTSFARVDGMKKPLAAISASCCAMSVVGGSSTAFNMKQAVSDDLAGDVIEYDAALGQAVAALSHVRHLAKKIEDGVGRCKSIDAGVLGRSSKAGYDGGDQSSSSPAFGWIDESYHQVAEKQKEWIRQRESVEKELSGILLNGLQPASKDQSKARKKK